MLPRSRFKPLNNRPDTLTPPDPQKPASKPHRHISDDDWPCLTCNRWSQNCCGPWETPQEHEHD